MYKTGRTILGWIALLAAVAALLTLVFGLVFPPGLQAVEKVMCPSGTTVETNGNSLDALRRSSSAHSYSQYCTSPSEFVDVTVPWFFLIGGSLLVCGACLLVRSRLTPPLLQAPRT